MVLETSTEAPRIEAHASKVRFPRRRLVIATLYALCALFGIGIAVNAIALAGMVPGLLNTGVTAVAVRYLLVGALVIVLDATTLVLFLSFVLTVGRKAEFFSKRQTARLLVLGAVNAACAFAGLLMPTFTPPAALGGSLTPISVVPELDLRSLVLSMMFFALAGVFEYGRILQEDTENIL